MRSPLVFALAIALGLSACTQAPNSSPPLAGESPQEVGSPDAREVQQLVLRDIPRGEVSRIRDFLNRRRSRALTPLPGISTDRAGAYDTGAESEVKRLTDQARALSAASALFPNASLQQLARAHSMDMAGQRQLSLTGSDGKTVTDWLNQAGVTYKSTGIRVHRAPAGSFTLAPTDTDAIIIRRREDWINNSQGNVNPLDPTLYDVGIGVVKGGDGNLYITAIFRQAP